MSRRIACSLLFILSCLPLLSWGMEGDLKKRVCVIVNPVSGGIDKTELCDNLLKRLDKESFEVEMLYTESPKHATLLAKEAIDRHAEIIVGVGGDGLINEISQSLIGSNATLAIIPAGSGNGLARHLKIPMKGSDAIDLIAKGLETTIDTVLINDKHYLSIAGIGFDAEVSQAFSELGARGVLSYFLVTLQKLSSYRPNRYHISIDGKELSTKAFLICFANSSQFGNNAYIAPLASIKDGLLDLVVVKKVPLLAAPKLVYQLFNQSLHHSKYVEMHKCKEIIVHGEHLMAHIDGEPIFFDDDIHIQIHPSSLKVLVPENCN